MVQYILNIGNYTPNNRMGKINVLPDELVSKIAAGEVVERPASVVKEIIENSIDAGADEIIVETNEGGKSQIIIMDNGVGMSYDDALMSVKRHATSKIVSQDDLYNIRTLGFRGEALASIAAVSKLRITTRNKESIQGTVIEAENSKVISAKPVGCSIGTVVEVSSLFYNLPARKKYLGTVKYEFSRIMNIVIRYALINPYISFRLLHNNKNLLISPKTSTLLENIAGIYGNDIAKQLIPVKYNSVNFSIEGYVSKPTLTRNSRDMQCIYINSRYIKSPEIINFIYEAYHTMLHTGRHPVLIVNLSINPRMLDVNVHPAKEIVKIEGIYRFKEEISCVVRKSLVEMQEIPAVVLEKITAMPVHEYKFSPEKQEVLALRESEQSYHVNKLVDVIIDKIGPFIVIGQLNKTYIIAENMQGLMLVDQHAAQERINYERLMKELSKGSVSIQSLIKPRLVELSAQEARVLSENRNLLKRIGFSIEEFGDNSFLVRSMPMIFERFEQELIIDIIKELSDIEAGTIDEVKERRIITRACRKSIKAGDELTLPYMESLIRELSLAEQPFTCPHGRPTIINVTIAELERKFKRVC